MGGHRNRRAARAAAAAKIEAEARARRAELKEEGGRAAEEAYRAALAAGKTEREAQQAAEDVKNAIMQRIKDEGVDNATVAREKHQAVLRLRADMYGGEKGETLDRRLARSEYIEERQADLREENPDLSADAIDQIIRFEVKEQMRREHQHKNAFTRGQKQLEANVAEYGDEIGAALAVVGTVVAAIPGVGTAAGALLIAGGAAAAAAGSALEARQKAIQEARDRHRAAAAKLGAKETIDEYKELEGSLENYGEDARAFGEYKVAQDLAQEAAQQTAPMPPAAPVQAADPVPLDDLVKQAQLSNPIPAQIDEVAVAIEAKKDKDKAAGAAVGIAGAAALAMF